MDNSRYGTEWFVKEILVSVLKIEHLNFHKGLHDL